MDVLSIDLSAAERQTYRESRDSGAQLPPLGRNPSELVRAYEAGEDRTDLLREARYLQFMRPYEADIKPLVQRLFLSRAGDPARINAHMGDQPLLYEPIRGYANRLCERIMPGNEVLFTLVVFDDEAALVCSRPGSYGADIIYYQRSVAFEEHLFTRDHDKADLVPWETFSPAPTRVVILDEPAGHMIDVEKMSEFVKGLSRIFEGRYVVAVSNIMRCVHPPYTIGEDRLQLEKVKPIYCGNFEDPEALAVFGECVKTCYNDWWESIRHGPFPPPFSLTRAHRRTVRGPHIVMRALLERRRAMLGKDALFVIYNLYRRMPDPMFRVILSFL